MREQIVAKGPYDAIFLDHAKFAYLPDLKLLMEYGVVKKGVLVMGDNMIIPGNPTYLDYFRENKEFSSVLYHSCLEYSNKPDALLASIKL